jgi:hypothetical protein
MKRSMENHGYTASAMLEMDNEKCFGEKQQEIQ